MKTKLYLILAVSVIAYGGGAVWGDCCVAPENGTGTADFPPAGCVYTTPNGDMHIVDGLPAGTSIEIDASNGNFTCSPAVGVCSFPPSANCRAPGGSLGGKMACLSSLLTMPMVGTGALAGFNKEFSLPSICEVHSAPRTLGAPVQSFDTDMFRLQGQITGDPDFDLLRVTAGTDFGLPSPGHTTLTRQPGGDWAVDSFFDITYRIDFVGAPGGKLAGRSGSTTGTIRMVTCVGQAQNVKWVKLPDKTSAGMDIRIDRGDQVPRVMADDFLCTQMGPITDIHFWGSWKGDLQPHLLYGIHLSIHKDIPADPTQPGSYSRPGEVLWEKNFSTGQFAETLYASIAPQFEWWWDPYRQDINPQGDQNIWQYDVYIDPADAFIQEGTPDDPVVYWLDIYVLTEGGVFGWKTASEHWNDDAVYGGPAGTAIPWLELIYPKGHPQAGKSIDMAFAITTQTITEPKQGCCLPDGTCTNLTAADCVEKNGNPQGPGTNCATTPCVHPIPTEKCCLPDGNCANLTAAECRAKGGVSNGPGTACDGLPCPKPCEIPPMVCPSGDKATVINYTAGIADNYVLPTEATSPDAALLSFITTCSAPGIPLQFDQVPGEGSVPANSWLGHTFTGLPNGIVAARLQVRARATKGGGSSGTYNDAICFISSIAGCTPTYAWASRFANLPEAGGTWNPGQTGTFCLDLAALPTSSGPKNLLSLLASGSLRIYVVDDTGIDSMKLTVAVCPCKYQFPLSMTAGVNEKCQFSPPLEPASPSTAMTTAMPGLWRTFDDVLVANRRFGHTFTGLPAGIVAAQLEICLRATEDFPQNDILYLSFLNPTFAWSKSLPSLTGLPWNVGDQKLLILDLGNLPPSGAGVTSVLGNMAGGSLDVCIQDDTAVDYMILRYSACCRKTVDGDINLDGTVNLVDFSILAGNWLVTAP